MLKKSTSEEAIVANAMPVLKVFKNSLHKPLRLADIEKRIGLSHQSVFRKMKILKDNGILLKEGNYYKPNIENSLALKILELISAGEREEFFKKYSRLKEPFGQIIDFAYNNKEILYIMLFGSYATGKAAKTSDIDIFVVMKEYEIRKRLDSLLSQIEGGYFLKKYGFAPVYAAQKDVKEMVNEKKKFIQAIIEEGIIIYGEENYFKEMQKILKEWSAWK